MHGNQLRASLVEHAPAILGHQIDLLRRLVRCRTVSAVEPDDGFKQDAERARDVLLAELDGLGVTADHWLVDHAFPVVFARLAMGSPAPTIGFNGHFDVVPIEDPAKWTHDPWAGDVVDNRLYGRGACDAKGSIVAMLGALRLLRASDTEPAANVMLHLVSDEEVAGHCTDSCLDHGAPDAVIVGEPSFPEVWNAEPGLEHVRVEIDGLATHALNRWKALDDSPGSEEGGVNAIDKAMIVATAVRELERAWTTTQRYPNLPPRFNTITLGTIVGGKSQGPHTVNLQVGPGSVADYCALEYNLWYYPHQSLEGIKAQFEERVLQACQRDWWLQRHPPRFRWALHGLTNPPAETDPAHPLAQTLLAASLRVDARAHLTAMQGASLLPWYTRRGIPGVIFGAGSVSQAHGVDEFIDLDNLQATTIALALALADRRLRETPLLGH
jgi:acetylornithine deacetylase